MPLGLSNSGLWEVFIHKDDNSIHWVSAEHAFLTQSSQPLWVSL